MKKSAQFFKHCPVCGTRFAARRGRTTLTKGAHQHPKCTACGFTFYQNSKPTASVIPINARGEIMLVERGINPRKGYWDTAGGFLEEWEAPEAGARRELKEELGVRLKNLQLLGAYLDVYDEGYRAATMNITYVAEIAGGRINPQDDVAGYRWFEPSQLPWKRLAFPWIRQALKDLLNDFFSGHDKK